MEVSTQSRPVTPYRLGRNKVYQTTYQREYSMLKQAVTNDEGVPAGQRFPIGAPHELNEPIGGTSYNEDFGQPEPVNREPVFRPNTSRANRPHPRPQFTHWPRRPETAKTALDEDTKQALRNQLSSTYQVDFIGSPQGFPLPMAYNRSRSFWRNRGYYTLDSEYRNCYRNPPRTASNSIGRYAHSSRIVADSIIPLTLPMWKKTSTKTSYDTEFNQKTPSDMYMKNFVDSFADPTHM